MSAGAAAPVQAAAAAARRMRRPAPLLLAMIAAADRAAAVEIPPIDLLAGPDFRRVLESLLSLRNDEARQGRRSRAPLRAVGAAEGAARPSISPAHPRPAGAAAGAATRPSAGPAAQPVRQTHRGGGPASVADLRTAQRRRILGRDNAAPERPGADASASNAAVPARVQPVAPPARGAARPEPFGALDPWRRVSAPAAAIGSHEAVDASAADAALLSGDSSPRAQALLAETPDVGGRDRVALQTERLDGFDAASPEAVRARDRTAAGADPRGAAARPAPALPGVSPGDGASPVEAGTDRSRAALPAPTRPRPRGPRLDDGAAGLDDEAWRHGVDLS